MALTQKERDEIQTRLEQSKAAIDRSVIRAILINQNRNLDEIAVQFKQIQVLQEELQREQVQLIRNQISETRNNTYNQKNKELDEKLLKSIEAQIAELRRLNEKNKNAFDSLKETDQDYVVNQFGKLQNEDLQKSNTDTNLLKELFKYNFAATSAKYTDLGYTVTPTVDPTTGTVNSVHVQKEDQHVDFDLDFETDTVELNDIGNTDEDIDASANALADFIDTKPPETDKPKEITIEGKEGLNHDDVGKLLDKLISVSQEQSQFYSGAFWERVQQDNKPSNTYTVTFTTRSLDQVLAQSGIPPMLFRDRDLTIREASFSKSSETDGLALFHATGVQHAEENGKARGLDPLPLDLTTH
ncbi:hypothetical protein L3V82_04550 [Thiotrichales bacterium 19S3-7]|nr:hypothetical protein [Thiotrichales bacterium 19S3-7]MCF6801366.1 hypothetical protein [Thiotrichales bacterium 19S3-11]